MDIKLFSDISFFIKLAPTCLFLFFCLILPVMKADIMISNCAIHVNSFRDVKKLWESQLVLQKLRIVDVLSFIECVA